MTTLETGRTPHSSSSIYRTALLRELMIATRSSRMSAALSTARGAIGLLNNLYRLRDSVVRRCQYGSGTPPARSQNAPGRVHAAYTETLARA